MAPRMTRTSDRLLFRGLPYHASWEEWIRVLSPLYTFETEDLSRRIVIQHPVDDWPRKDMDKILQCLVLTRSDHTRSLLRSTLDLATLVAPEDVVNQILPSTTTWHDVHPLRRFFLPRLTTYFDPEYMILAWMVQMENYDGNCRALIPAYPKTIYNVRLLPREIQQVVDVYCLRLEIWRPVLYPSFKGRTHDLLQDLCYPLSWLCTTNLGKAVLTFVYEMLEYVDRDPSQGQFETRLHLLTHLLTFCETHMVAFPYGVAHFHGMPNPQFRVETWLAQGLLLHSVFYNETLIRHSMDARAVQQCTRAFRMYTNRFWKPTLCLTQADLSPRGEPIFRCVRSHYLHHVNPISDPRRTSTTFPLRRLGLGTYYRQLMLQPVFLASRSRTPLTAVELLRQLTLFTASEKDQHRSTLVTLLGAHLDVARRLLPPL